MQRPSAERVIGVGLGIGAVALVVLLVLGLGSELIARSASTPSPKLAGASPTATASPPGTVAPLQTDASQSASPSPAQTAVPSPTAVPTPTLGPTISPQLPAMLAAIGDSYTQAWSVSPAYKRDHPGYSWAVGSAKGDGVFSLRERFEALGDRIVVVDAATSGKKMIDAARQATLIVADAAKLPAGATAYVTFELGTNDLCDDPTTDPAAFEAQLRSAIDTLRAGLPAGSRILMLSVPDFAHFRDITQADSRASATLRLRINSRMCAPFLGSDSPLSIPAAEQVLSTYNAILARVCDEIEAADGPSGTLYCRRDEALLSEGDFGIRDLSTVDYFHPSLSGQAKMAASAWKAGYWTAVPLPPGAAAFAPDGAAAAGGLALAGIVPIAPALLGHRPRRRRIPGRGAP